MRDRCAGAICWARQDEEGASLSEYILIVFLIAMVCVAGVAFLGRHARLEFASVGRVIERGH